MKKKIEDLTLEQIVTAIKHNKVKCISILAIIVVVIIFAAVAASKKSGNDVALSDFSTDEAVLEYKQEAVNEEYAEDENGEIKNLITNYYAAYASGDTTAVEKYATPVSDMEKSYIGVFSQYAQNYQDVTCYLKEGYNNNSYFVSVVYSLKFKDIETLDPGLDFFYVQTNEDGELYIDNVYSNFNLTMNEYDQDDNIKALITAFEQAEDVAELQQQIQSSYDEAIDSDDDLAKMMEETLPEALEKWASSYQEESDDSEDDKDSDEAKKDSDEAEKESDNTNKESDDSKEETKENEDSNEEAESDDSKSQETSDDSDSKLVYAKTKVNVRKKAKISAQSLGVLEKGDSVTLIKKMDNGWSKVKYKGKSGYVMSKYLKSTKTSDSGSSESELSRGDKVRLSESVNIRSKKSTKAGRVGLAYAGNTLTVLKVYDDGWTKVRWKGKKGYVKTSVLLEQ